MIYYHCTSDIFLKSILKNGLGKVNPNFDFKLLDLLKYLFEVAESRLSNEEDFKKLVFTTELMINQEIKYVDKEVYKVDILNFKHDGVFLTLGDKAAITHSYYNLYGSEILNRIMQILRLLNEYKIEVNIPQSLNMMDIESLLEYNPRPVFIKVKNIDDKYLLNQRDIPMSGVMKKIENKLKLSPDNVSFAFRQISAFKYIKPIKTEDIEVYYLDYDGHPIDDDFEYYLTKIK